MSNVTPLRIATFLAPNVYPVYRFIADTIGEKLDRPTDIIFVKSHDEYDAVNADVSFICGLPYVLWTGDNPKNIELLAAPVLIGERYQDKPIYFSDVIVRKDSPYHTLENLRGQVWAYNEKVSQSGYGITRHALLQMGETEGFFGKVVNARSHQNAMRLITKGKIDAAAIDSQVLAVEMRLHPRFSGELRIIDTFGPSPIQPVVANSKLPDTLKEDIQAAFLTIADDAAAQNKLSAGLFKCFVAVVDSDYDPIREMLAQAAAAGFMTIR